MNETAQQIEFLIETVQQDFELKSSLLEDVVEGEVLVAEQLQDIRVVLNEIKEGLFNFFEDEIDRFQVEQVNQSEQEFRERERLRETAAINALGADDENQQIQEQERPGFRSSFGDSFRGAGLGARAAAGRFAGAAARRIPQIALLAGAVTAAVDYFAEFESSLQQLSEEGVDPETAMTEAATRAASKLAADFSNVVLEPIGNFGLDLIAEEFGLIPEEVAEFRKSIDSLSESLGGATTMLVDWFSETFGDETSFAQERQTERQIENLEEDIAAAGQREDRLAEIEEELNTTEGIDRVKLVAEKAALTGIQKVTGSAEELEQELADTREMGELSQAGFAAEAQTGTLETERQEQFRTEVRSSDKQDWLKENTDPLLRSAVESGAISIPMLERAEIPGQIQNLERAGKLVISGQPLEIENLEALKELSAEQLEAILINDDILNRSFFKGGALDNGTRKVVEYLYRVKSGMITPAPSSPNLPDTPTADGTVDPTGASPAGASSAVEPVSSASVAAVSESVTPLPSVAGGSGSFVAEASRNVSAQASTPIIIDSSKGGDVINNNVQNNSTTNIAGSPPARSTDVSHRRSQDRSFAGVP